MKDNNSFDRKLETWGSQVPRSIHDAVVHVTDTLVLAWSAAQSVFGDQAKPEHALKILELFLSEAAQNERRLHECEEAS